MNKLLDKLSSKTLFEVRLQNIQNINVRLYFYSFFNLKTISLKIITFIILCLICALPYFVLRQWSLDNVLTMKVVFNSGAAFNFGDDWNQTIVYIFKIAPTVIFFFLFLFSNKWTIYIPSCLIFLNSLFIIIDKSLVDVVINADNSMTKYDNTVVDYFDFKIFVNNIGDIFICLGIALLAISIIYLIIVEWKKVNKKDENDVSNS